MMAERSVLKPMPEAVDAVVAVRMIGAPQPQGIVQVNESGPISISDNAANRQ